VLISAEPGRLEAYYVALEGLNGDEVRKAVERIAPQPVPHLPHFIKLFSSERFLWDYEDDAKLLYRLNQVMRRVNLPPLPAQFVAVFRPMRTLVAARSNELLQKPVVVTH
jgi:hypothetical protein